MGAPPRGAATRRSWSSCARARGLFAFCSGVVLFGQDERTPSTERHAAHPIYRPTRVVHLDNHHRTDTGLGYMPEHGALAGASGHHVQGRRIVPFTSNVLTSNPQDLLAGEAGDGFAGTKPAHDT